MAHRDHDVHSDVGDRPRDLVVALARVVSELRHLPEHADGSAPGCALLQVLERRSHRDRVRVPGVVDEEPAAWKLDLLVSPVDELHAELSRRLEPKCARCGERAERIRREVPRREVDLDVSEARLEKRRVERFDADVLSDPDDREVGTLHDKARRNDRRAPGRKGRDELALGADHAFDRPNSLQMDRADRDDDADRRRRQLRQLGYLAETAHRELDDADLRVGLEPAQRQRNADLVVEAPLRRDGSPLRPGDRGEDVLRRRLAVRAGDSDDGGRGALAHGARQGSEGGERVVGDERGGGTPLAGVGAEIPSAAHGDEQIALGDAARVHLHTRHVGGVRTRLQTAGTQCCDVTQRKRDHVSAFTRRLRSASRATSRSSNGILPSRNS